MKYYAKREAPYSWFVDVYDENRKLKYPHVWASLGLYSKKWPHYHSDAPDSSGRYSGKPIEDAIVNAGNRVALYRGHWDAEAGGPDQASNPVAIYKVANLQATDTSIDFDFVEREAELDRF
jgi:hypothetical protein